MLLLSVQLPSARLNVFHSLFFCLLSFFPLIHVSDSRRGKLKSAAHHSWSSRPHRWGMKPCLLSLVFTCFSCGQWELPLVFGMSTHPAWHLGLLSSIHHVTISGGQEQRLGLTHTWTVGSTGSYPLFYLLPSCVDKIAGDNECLMLLCQCYRKVGTL